jgi:hypothetical protein
LRAKVLSEQAGERGDFGTAPELIDIDGQPGHRLHNQDNTSPAVSTIEMGLDVHRASVVLI